MPSELIYTLAGTYARCTRLVDLALSDLTDEQAARRSRGGSGPSITFLAGHLLACRASLLQWFGARDDNPWREAFGSGASVQDGVAYPPIAELRASWKSVGVTFDAALEQLDSETLLADSPHQLPGDDQTNRGLLQDLGHHECYHLGQIGMLRADLSLCSIDSLEQ